jgi:hypothetical protein
MELLLSIALGATLSAAAGFRAFLPLFLLGVLQRYDLMGGYSLGEKFQWLSSDPAMACLSAATIIEVVADKIPAVDSALDGLMTFIRPAAGALSVLAVLSPQDPVVAYVASVVFAGGATLPIHLGKSMLRLGSHATTAGAASPLLSIFEDLSAGGAIVLAVLVPVCALLLAALALLMAIWFWRRLRKRRKQEGT